MLVWALKFIEDGGKYQWQITRLLVMLVERMGRHPQVQGLQVVVAILSACVLVDRYSCLSGFSAKNIDLNVVILLNTAYRSLRLLLLLHL
jgi:hypothetical protein